MYFAPLFTSAPPEYSGKYRSSGTCATLSDGFELDGSNGTHLGKLVPEDVDLIEEEDNRRSEEPPRVDH